MDRSSAKERTTIRLPPMVTILMTAAATLRTTIQTVLRQSYDSRTTTQTIAPRRSYYDPDGRATVVRQSYDSRTIVVPRSRRSCDSCTTTQRTAPRRSNDDQDSRTRVVTVCGPRVLVLVLQKWSSLHHCSFITGSLNDSRSLSFMLYN